MKPELQPRTPTTRAAPSGGLPTPTPLLYKSILSSAGKEKEICIVSTLPPAHKSHPLPAHPVPQTGKNSTSNQAPSHCRVRLGLEWSDQCLSYMSPANERRSMRGGLCPHPRSPETHQGARKGHRLRQGGSGANKPKSLSSYHRLNCVSQGSHVASLWLKW